MTGSNQANTVGAVRLIALLTTLVVAGCGGGADTETFPQLNLPTTTNYTGPAPATADVQSFMINLWDNVARPDRCGGCHSDTGGQAPMFARSDDVNLAYDAVLSLVDLGSPGDSRLVTKVAGGHNCWESVPSVCGDIMTGWIENWGGNATGEAARQIDLQPPVLRQVGASWSFPADSDLFRTTIHALVTDPNTANCVACHSSNANPAVQQTPYFADEDWDVAYDAIKSKIDLEEPDNSRLVLRLRYEFHNCWDDCATSAATMEAAILAFKAGTTQDPIDPNLILSAALNLFDGIIASGGNRYEANQIALWEFKTGTGTTAFDTSGVDPAINLTLSDPATVTWVGGWGVEILSGKLQGSTTASKKLHDMIKSSGEYSIEAWVVPGNVAQEEARIISYSAGTMARNFHLGQTLYAYDFYNRNSSTDGNGEPFMQTSDADEDLQATLQHVVATYDPINGRRIYVNGVFTDDVDPVPGGTLADWDDTFAFVLGNEVSSDRQWMGVVRQVAIHNRVLTAAQIQQNFDVGVGEKFFLLFSLPESVVGMPQAYILFEVSQFDNYSYLFNAPIFISLDAAATPGNIPIAGMRIGINGAESPVSQAYQNLDTQITNASYTPLGQPLSDLGTIIAAERGVDSDLFFLTFEVLGNEMNFVTEPAPLAPTPLDGDPASDIGVKTFDEINASFSMLTGIPTTSAAVSGTFTLVKTQLPTIEDIGAFSAAHEIGIAQLAIEYCNVLIEDVGERTAYFPGFDFGVQPSVAFGARDLVLIPLIENAMNIGLGSQPAFADVRNELGYITTPHLNLIDRLIASGDSDGERTQNITKAVCAAVLGSAVTIVQ
jgi:mono/diheme cytochrome c family protein